MIDTRSRHGAVRGDKGDGTKFPPHSLVLSVQPGQPSPLPLLCTPLSVSNTLSTLVYVVIEHKSPPS